jgi:hypothetical protein
MVDGANPFGLDVPVRVDQLIGRHAEADTISGWTREERLMVLVAPRRYGKTSLIHKVACDGGRDGLVVVTVDLFGVASIADLVLRLERAWAEHAPDRLRPAATKILDAARAGVSISGPGFAMTLAGNSPAVDSVAALHALLELPAQLVQQVGGRVLIVLDDFRFGAGVPEAEFQIWRHAQQRREAVSYLFSTGQPDRISEDQEQRVPDRPVSTLRLGRLPAAELREEITQRFAAGDRDATGVLDRLLNTGQEHPQRTMLLAHSLWEKVNSGERATNGHWEAALAVALRQIVPEARATMGGLSAGQRKVMRAVAEYGTPMAARALRVLGLPKTTAQKATPHLVAAGLIEEANRGWRVIDPLLAHWIRTKYGTRA